MAYAEPLAQKVSVSFGCQGIPRMDTGSQSDPFLVVEMCSRQTNNAWQEVFRTDTARDTQETQFPKHWKTDYFFEETQQVRLSVYDEDKPRSRRLEDHDYIGTAETTLGQIVSTGGALWLNLVNPSPSATLKKRSKGGTQLGRVSARGEEASLSREQTLTFNFKGVNLDKKDLFGKSDPYLQIYRQTQDGWELVHQTETIKKTLNPQWRPFSVLLTQLNNGVRSRPLKFSVWDWDKSGGHDHIGDFVLNGGLEELEAQFNDRRSFTCSLINPKMQRKKKYVDSGKLVLGGYLCQNEHTFIEYLQGGLQINLMFAIDFTGSNGVPTSPSSLHYQNPNGQFNQYQRAILDVGNVVAPYDSDGMMPVYGFGGKVNGRADFCFPLTFQANPEVPGVHAVLDVYKHAIAQVPLYGPTNLAPMIRQAIEIASANQNSFLILLILTDGEISDMPDTIDAIVEASRFPISIIITGIGNANFASMERLDSDDELLRGRRGHAEADIVQFVEFRKYADRHPSELARETLREVPGQVTGFFKRRNIQPHAPVQRQFAPNAGFSPPPQ